MVEMKADQERVYTQISDIDPDNPRTKITIAADFIGMQRTGTHARVSIYVNQELLAYSRLNADGADQRTRLANSAHRQLSERMQSLYPQARMRHELDLFCSQLWNTYTGTVMAELEAGDPDYEPTYYAKPLVLEGGGTVLFAPGGSGKSFLAMTLACSIEYGHSELWEDIQSYPTLYINLERDPRLMRRRLSQVNVCLGADPRTPLRFLHARGRSLADVRAGIQRTVDEHGIGLIVVDSISRTGQGDLNDNETANAIIDSLNGICPTWVAIAHTSKANKHDIFGSTHFTNGADLTVRLTHVEEPNKLGMRLKQMKTNDVGKSPDTWLAYEFEGNRLTKIRPSSSREFPDLADEQTPAERVAEYLASEGATTVRDICVDLDLSETTVRSVLRAKTDKHKFTRVSGSEKGGMYALLFEDHASAGPSR